MICKVIIHWKLKQIEDEINEWLKNNPSVNIKHCTQTIVKNQLITSIFYEE